MMIFNKQMEENICRLAIRKSIKNESIPMVAW